MLNNTIRIVEDVQSQEYMQASTKNQIWFLAISGRSTVQDSGNHYHIKCGTAAYQVRKWSALHHHMAFVMVAMLFMLDDRIRHEEPICCYRVPASKNFCLVFSKWVLYSCTMRTNYERAFFF
jgi:hypothetical protein